MKRTAVHDAQRKGILIPRDQLEGTDFQPGDRFAVTRGQRDFFCVVLERDARGDIFFDKQGIFVERSRRVDILLGGIFDTFTVEIGEAPPGTIRIKAEGVGLRSMQNL
jgi:hypothetical protein